MLFGYHDKSMCPTNVSKNTYYIVDRVCMLFGYHDVPRRTLKSTILCEGVMIQVSPHRCCCFTSRPNNKFW